MMCREGVLDNVVYTYYVTQIPFENIYFICFLANFKLRKMYKDPTPAIVYI